MISHSASGAWGPWVQTELGPCPPESEPGTVFPYIIQPRKPRGLKSSDPKDCKANPGEHTQQVIDRWPLAAASLAQAGRGLGEELSLGPAILGYLFECSLLMEQVPGSQAGGQRATAARPAGVCCLWLSFISEVAGQTSLRATGSQGAEGSHGRRRVMTSHVNPCSSLLPPTARCKTEFSADLSFSLCSSEVGLNGHCQPPIFSSLLIISVAGSQGW